MIAKWRCLFGIGGSAIILKKGSQVFYAGREKYTIRLIGGKDSAAMIEVVKAKGFIAKMVGIVTLQGGAINE